MPAPKSKSGFFLLAAGTAFRMTSYTNCIVLPLVETTVSLYKEFNVNYDFYFDILN